MSLKPPIGYVDLRVFVHATENSEKVLTAVRNLLPSELAETVGFEKNSLVGHHGNPITLFTAQLTDKKHLPFLLQKISAGLNALDKEKLNQDIKLYLEKHNMYLRFDKQSAFLETFKLAQNDPIAIKVHFKNKKPEEILEILQNYGLLQ
jgi:RNA binding exosome subunit